MWCPFRWTNFYYVLKTSFDRFVVSLAVNTIDNSYHYNTWVCFSERQIYKKICNACFLKNPSTDVLLKIVYIYSQQLFFNDLKIFNTSQCVVIEWYWFKLVNAPPKLLPKSFNYNQISWNQWPCWILSLHWQYNIASDKNVSLIHSIENK